MFEFFDALRTQTFLQNALAGGILASLACGIIGPYVVVKRIVFISGGIAHTVLAGVGLALVLGLHPLAGAIPCALLAAIFIGLIGLRARQREDTIIGACWVIGMAVGLILFAQVPGYNTDLMSYLFGDILMVSSGNLSIIMGLDILIAVFTLLFYKQFLAVCFDEEYARVQGVRVEPVYLLLLCLIALTVIVLMQVIGIVLVIGLLTLPAATAGLFARSVAWMMLIAAILGVLFTMIGIWISYTLDFPTGPTIAILSGAAYLLSISYKAIRPRYNQTNKLHSQSIEDE